MARSFSTLPYPDANLMAVSITSTGSELRIATPVPLFTTNLPIPSGDLPGFRSYDVSSKGFLMNVITTESALAPIIVIHNWSAGLKEARAFAPLEPPSTWQTTPWIKIKNPAYTQAEGRQELFER